MSHDVCRVPLEDEHNAAAVAAVLGGSYHESPCGILEKCSSLHVQYGNGSGSGAMKSVNHDVATWFSCELDTVRIGILLVVLVVAAIIVFQLIRRFRHPSHEMTPAHHEYGHPPRGLVYKDSRRSNR